MDSYASIPLGQTSPKADFIPTGQPLARVRLSIAGLLECIAFPVILYAGIFLLLSSEMHYSHPGVTYACLFLGLVFSLTLFLKGYLLKIRLRETRYDVSWEPRFNLEGVNGPSMNGYEYLNQRVGGGAGRNPRTWGQDPQWFFFLGSCCLLAWFCAVCCGWINFSMFVRPYHDAMNLSEITNLDPASSGKQYLDVNRVFFKENSYVAQNLSLSFKDYHTYCVAPITLGNTPQATYDFWAVGIDCCNAFGGGFYCGGDVNNPTAHSAIRLMGDDERPYFRLAVQQAEAEYGIRALHPLFFIWTAHPEKAMAFLLTASKKFLIYGVLFMVAFQAIVVCFCSNYMRPTSKN